MRIALAVGLILLQLSTAMIWLLRPEKRSAFERWIPQDILALIVINDAPAHLDFLERTRLKNWFDLDADKLRQKVSPPMQEQIAQLFRRDLLSAWILVHRLGVKPGGSLRVDFSALLVPRPLHREALKLRIELATLNFFGAGDTSTFERENIRIYKGARPGQILYLVEMPDWLLISNSEEGWQSTLQTTTGLTPSLADSLRFRRVQSHLRIDSGLFVYFRGSELLPLLPEFGYVVPWNDEDDSDEYYEIPRNTRN